MKKWEVTCCRWEQLKDHIASGWEPFSVTDDFDEKKKLHHKIFWLRKS